MNYESCLERLTMYFSSDKYRNELVTAKEDFFDEGGVDGAENQEFEHKHNLFFDWYLLTRPLAGTLLTPAQMVLDLDGFEIESDELPYYAALAKAKNCIFEYLKTKKTDHYIRDVFTGQKYVIKNSSLTMAAEKGVLFSTHLILDEGDNSFSMSMIFHPNEVRKFILNECKKLKTSSEQDRAVFTLRLMKMNFKHEKYPHVGFDQIYSLESTMRF